MLFVTLLKPKPGATVRAQTERRLGWKYPEGIKVLGEYWLTSQDPETIVIAECDDPILIMDAVSDWEDLYEARVFTAVTAEHGLAHARDVLQARAA